MSLGKRTLKELRDELSECVGDVTSSRRERLISAIERELRPKKFVRASRVRRAEKARGRKAEMAELRARVLERAGGRCECCGHASAQLEVDHFVGGFGRRKSLESVFTCWALNPGHHRDKTRNRPGPDYWLRRFIEHCDRQGGSGYNSAASIAQCRLDALTLQGTPGARF